jgi:Cu(I)/Ag(I) efflux system membrane fusion protein
VIPATAALVTGKRAIVYVKLPDAEQPTFVGRQIVLGPKAGEWYIVREGLAEGEEVVTHGNFKIDSALQIQALPSMMSPEGQPMPGHVGHDMPAAAPGSAERVDVPPAFRRQLSAAIDAYMPLSAALSADDMPAAKTAATSVIEAVRAVDASSLADKSAWTDRAAPLTAALEAIVATDDIEAVRVKFSEVSEHLAALARRFGAERTLYLMKCPMAFNDVGARWLQYDTDVANPYFGASMFRCGEVVETIEAVKNGGDAAKASVTGRHAHE